MPSYPREILFLSFKTVCHANILEKIIQSKNCHSRNRNTMENCLLMVWCCKRATLAPKLCLHTVLFKVERTEQCKKSLFSCNFFFPTGNASLYWRDARGLIIKTPWPELDHIFTSRPKTFKQEGNSCVGFSSIEMHPLKLGKSLLPLRRLLSAKYINCFLLVRKEQEEGGRREDKSWVIIIINVVTLITSQTSV